MVAISDVTYFGWHKKLMIVVFCKYLDLKYGLFWGFSYIQKHFWSRLFVCCFLSCKSIFETVLASQRSCMINWWKCDTWHECLSLNHTIHGYLHAKDTATFVSIPFVLSKNTFNGYIYSGENESSGPYWQRDLSHLNIFCLNIKYLFGFGTYHIQPIYIFLSHWNMSSSGGACATPGCTKVVEQRLACPKCIKMGLPPAYFCSQKCFVDNYSSHKSIHSLAKTILEAKAQK